MCSTGQAVSFPVTLFLIGDVVSVCEVTALYCLRHWQEGNWKYHITLV